MFVSLYTCFFLKGAHQYRTNKLVMLFADNDKLGPELLGNVISSRQDPTSLRKQYRANVSCHIVLCI